MRSFSSFRLGAAVGSLGLAVTAAAAAVAVPGLAGLGLEARAVQNASDAAGFFNVSASGGNWLTVSRGRGAGVRGMELFS